MARLEGITGGLSGKMGSAVFRQSGGKTIASQYQPIVKNPNSEGQQAQRAKFKLMSQLAAIMSRGFGSFIIKTRAEKGKGTQRNAFVQTNFPLVQVTEETAGGVTAKIPMEQLQLTTSFRTLPTFNTEGTSATVGYANVNIPNVPSDVTTIRVVAVGYQVIEGGAKQAFIESITDCPVTDGEIDQQISYLAPKTVGEQVTILAFGLIPSEAASKKIDLDNIHTPADENFISAIKLDQMVSDGQMAETKTIGINLTVTQE